MGVEFEPDVMVDLPPDVVVVSGSPQFVAWVGLALQTLDEDRFALRSAKIHTAHFREQIVLYAWVSGGSVHEDDLLLGDHYKHVIALGREYIDHAHNEMLHAARQVVKQKKKKYQQLVNSGQQLMFGEEPKKGRGRGKVSKGQ